LGHASPAITAGIYTHSTSELGLQHDVIDALAENFLSAPITIDETAPAVGEDFPLTHGYPTSE